MAADDAPTRRTPIEPRTVAALVCGLVTFLPFGVGFSVPLGIGAVVLGHFAERRIERHRADAGSEPLRGVWIARAAMGAGIVGAVFSFTVMFYNGWNVIQF